MKRVLAIFLTAALLLCAAPLSGFSAVDLPTLFDGLLPRAHAATVVKSGSFGSDIRWSLDSDGVLNITGSGKMNLSSSVIKSVRFSPWYDYTSSIKKVVIGDGITYISPMAFVNCQKLEAVDIPGSVKEIGYGAFGDCPALRELVLPEGLTSVCRYAFVGCTALKYVYVSDTVTDLGAPINDSYFESLVKNMDAEFWDSINQYETAFVSCPSIEKIEVSAANSVYRAAGNCLINKNTRTLVLGGKNCVIPADGSVSTIGQYAFSASEMTSVTIPASVGQIQASAFMGCDSLADVYYTGTQTQWNAVTIEEGNDPLTSATLHTGSGASEPGTVVASGACGDKGDNVKWTLDSDGVLTISGRGRMKSFLYDENDFPGWFNNADSIKKVVIGNGVTDICEKAFWGCDALISVDISDSVTNIGAMAFAYCEALAAVAIPNSVRTIGAMAFAYCKALAAVDIPGSLKEIGPLAFINCSSLTKIVLPEGLTSLYRWTFFSCESLKHIYIPSTVTELGASVNGYESVFDESDLSYEANREAINQTPIAFIHCPSLEKIEVSAANPVFRSVGNCLINQNTRTLMLGCKNSVIPEDGSVVSIGPVSFYESPVQSVRIPASVKKIQLGAFCLCKELTDVYYGGSPTQWNAVSIEDYNEELLSATMHYGNGYSVSYDANGGSGAPAAQTKTEGNTLTLSSVKPTKSVTITYDAKGGSMSTVSKTMDCSFQNWNTKQDGTGTSYAPGGSYTANASVTLYAQWSNPTFGGLPTPTRSGYTFDGWYTEASGGTKITTSSAVAQSQTVYAHWTSVQKNEYSVSYDANGGSGAPYGQTKTEGVSLTLSSVKPTKSYTIAYDANGGSVSTAFKTVSCTFLNWNTRSDGSGASYAPGGRYTADASVTLYAQWTNPTAGTLAAPTRSGYTFDGWYTEASGGTKITASSTVSQPQTVYAHWTYVPKTFTVSYNANGGTGAPAAQTGTEGRTLTLSGTVPARSFTLTYDANGGSVSSASKTLNCAFKNWNTKSDGSGASYAPGGSYTADVGATLYAQWTNPAAGTLATPTRSGYYFDGWYTAASGGAKVTASAAVTKSQTLYAHWSKIITYTVDYNPNGGSGAPAGQSKTAGTTLKLSGTVPVKSFRLVYDANGGSVATATKTVNCTFRSWNTKQDGSGTSYTPGASYTKDAGLTLYAQWTNPTAGTLATPARDGYTFNGWYTAVSGGTKITSSSVVTKEQTLYAHWTAVQKKTFTVSYNANGGKGAPAAQTKTEGTALTLSGTVPTRTVTLTYDANGGSVSPASKTVGGTFRNWNTKQDGSGTGYAPGGSYTANASATLYAQWTDPTAGTLATPTRGGYTFNGWYTAAKGGAKVTAASTVTKSQTLYAHWQKTPDRSPFQWGADNWNFINNSYSGDFSAGTYRSQIDGAYLDVLGANLTNKEYQYVFNGTRSGGAWLDNQFGGSCYGMSAVTLLSKYGLLPFAEYKTGATKLYDLEKPTASRKVSSLITYYQMLQIKEVAQQQYRTVPGQTHEENIKQLLALLDQYPVVLTGFKKNDWGAHAILAYGYEYGSYKYDGVTYQGCIRICDPNAADKENPKCNIYFNTKTYSWTIPYYATYGVSSASGAVFTCLMAAVDEINEGGYLSGAAARRPKNYVARIDAAAIADERHVTKVKETASGGYQALHGGDDIVEDFSYIPGNASKGTAGFNLKDSGADYMITQNDPVRMQLSIDYEDCCLSAGTAAGQSVVFKKTGFVEVNGESAEYTMSMTFDGDHPTDWFTIEVKGGSSDKATLQKTNEGYVLTADDLTDTEVKANNRTDSAEARFSTKYLSVLIYEIDKTTVGVKVDADGNGTYETVVSTESSGGKMGDIDGDGKISSGDARLALRASVGLEKDIKKGTAAWQRCDVDNDGKVSSGDARLILRGSVGLEDVTKWKK